MPSSYRPHLRQTPTPLLLLALLAACSSSEPTPPPDSCWTTLDQSLLSDPRRADWSIVGESVLDNEGLTTSINVPLGTASRWVALRVSDPNGSPTCVQLDEVLDPASSPWVTPPASLDDYRSYCHSCPERVSVGVGSGFYVLPSGDPPPLPATNLDVRAAARDCATFLPAQSGSVRPDLLRIEAIPLPEMEDTRTGVIALDVILTPDSILHDDSATVPAALEQALATVNSIFAPTKLEIRAARIRRLDAENPLAFERGDYAALDNLYAQAYSCDPEGVAPSDFLVPVVFAGCFRRTDPVQMTSDEPNGFVPRIPDGLSPPGRASGIFIKGRDCKADGTKIQWAPDSLGKTVAHELGHYLGLYHSVESDASTDDLDDTDADNLMHWVSPSTKLSAGQSHVMRRHPAIRWQ